MGDSLKGLVVLISGSSSGLGAGMAVDFARYGSKVCLTGRNIDRLQQTSQQCQDVGLPESHIYLVTGDVTVKEDVVRIVNSSAEHFGRLDILVNNAGETRKRTVFTAEIEDLDFVYNVLVRSVFMMSKAALPHLEKTKGAIINMSSLAGLRPLAYAPTYSMCKCAVDRFTQIMAVAVGPKGIRVNSVNPAAIKTQMFDKPEGPGGDAAAAKKYLDWCAKAIPLGRIGEIQEVCNLVSFLASKQGEFLNGVLFPIDGSYSNTSFIPKLR